MSPRSLTPASCVSMGHGYAHVHLTRCEHTGGWAIDVWAASDRGDECPILYQWTTTSGPFDGDLWPADAIRPALIEAMLVVLETAGPPASPGTPTAS
jgi:hypothetical protein